MKISHILMFIIAYAIFVIGIVTIIQTWFHPFSIIVAMSISIPVWYAHHIYNDEVFEKKINKFHSEIKDYEVKDYEDQANSPRH